MTGQKKLRHFITACLTSILVLGTSIYSQKLYDADYRQYNILNRESKEVTVQSLLDETEALLKKKTSNLQDCINKEDEYNNSQVERFPRDCQDILREGCSESKVYKIYPQGSGELDVFCDQHTDGGGWTVIQRRYDGVIDFFRTWKDYKYGFGNKSGEYWLGNHIIYEIVQQGFYELRIDMADFNSESRYAVYKRFYIGGETTGYQLHVEDYEGTAVERFPRDCQDILWEGFTESKVYQIYPQGSGELDVFCDQHTDGGGWTVIQRRFDGIIDFFRNWKDYKYGFGNKTDEYWLGNHRIYEIVQQGFYELRIDMADFNSERRYALYKRFYIGDEASGYRLHLEDYEGTAGDSLLKRHSGYQFYTKDHDDSTGCANLYKGGWWYNNCHSSNLNGLYLTGTHQSYADGINWNDWHGYHYSLKTTEMKIRRL